MSEIKTNQELEVKNVLSFRGKIKPQGLDAIVKDMECKMKLVGAERIGNPITATYTVDKDGIDVEVLLPISKGLNNIGAYKYKERIKIVNAVLLSYKGNPAGLQNACNELNQYMVDNQLQPITVGYNITKHIDTINVENTEIDVYVGINPNIL